MATLQTDALLTKWQARFADNVTRTIDEGDFREFTQDIVDSFSSVFGGPTAIEWLNPCEYATTTNITLSGEQNIDGVLTSASRVLVRAQTIASQNGIYVSAAGAWTRATDADSAAEIEGAAVGITGGDTLINSSWIQTATDVTLGVTDIVWHQIGFGVSSQNLYQVLSEGNSAFGLTIEDVADPVNDQDVATRAWVLANAGTTLPDLEIEEVTTTTYSFVADDRFKIKMFTNVSGCTATVPIGLDTGWAVAVYRPTGAGTLTLASAGTYRGLDTTLGTAETWATITHLGSNIHAASGALGSLGLSIGTIDSQTKSANGGVLSGSSIYFQNADADNPGLVSTTTQTIAGDKTFTGSTGLGVAPIANVAATLGGTTSTSYTSLRILNNLASSLRALEIDYSGSAYAGSLLASSPSGESASISTTGAYPLAIGTNNIARIVISSTGTITIITAPSTSNSGNSILARNSTTGALELRNDVVVTSGAQTIGGVKTFSSTPVISATPSTSNSGNSILARNTSTGALELRSNISSGTYTPTLTNSTNISASTAYATQYTRIGDVVHVAGMVEIDATSVSTLTLLGVSLPVASDFAQVYQCAGTFYTEDSDTNANGGAIYADVTNNRATFSYFCREVATRTFLFTFTYSVI